MSFVETARRHPIPVFAVALLVVITLYVILHWNTDVNEDYLEGFWVAEDAFCEEAEIESLLLYIGEKKNGKRQCYIVISDDITNQSFTISYYRGFSGPGVSTYKIRAKAEFESEQIWDDGTVDISVDMRDGSIRIFDGDKLYVRARKQHEVTEAARYLSD
jgi:hypothetical protein